MAIMKIPQVLFAEPDENATALDEIADSGETVDVLGTQGAFTKIKVFHDDIEPEGWVPTNTIDLEGKPADEPIDKLRFARQCWIEALFSDANPHYVAAVAELRSGTANKKQGDDIGPFRFTQAEWDAGRAVKEFALDGYTAKDIADWRMQVVLFTLMTHVAELAMLAELNKITAGRRPSAAELYLAQLIGPKAAAAAAAKPADTIAEALTAAADNELPPGGLSRDQILARHVGLLGNAGPPVTPLTAQAAIDRIVANLDPVLAARQADIVKAGTELKGAPPADATLDSASQPLAPQAGGPANTADPPAGGPLKINGAGGVLGELIASGEGDYNSFNRGRAGDSHGAKIDFSRMTIQTLRAMQSLPVGNKNRLFAVGKYQIVPTTMAETVAALAIGGDEKFTPKLQEHCFRNYLVAGKRPSVKRFITGQSADLNAAQVALALEFASVGLPGSGKSAYESVGNNKASISPDKVAAALQQEKTKFSQLRQTMSESAAWTALSPGA
jgi:hypothetical protein